MNALRDREVGDRELRDRELRDRERDDYREPRSDYRDPRPSYRDTTPSDREISLGTGTILSIFFALALICAIFFGFGYSMGRRSAQPAAPVAEASTSGGLFSSFKPSAGNPVGSASFQKKDAARPAAETQTDSPDGDEPASSTPAATKQSAGDDPAPVIVKAQGTAVKATAPAATTPVPASAPAMPATNPNGTTMVQVAAVSHQEDADLLLSALKKRGYDVFIRHESQDRLLHVQVGPFSNKKDADIMRQRLLSDGYNAIVK